MNLLRGNKLSPWEDLFVNSFGSDVIIPNQLCTCICMYIGMDAGRSTCSGTMNLNRFAPWKNNCFVNSMFTSPNSIL